MFAFRQGHGGIVDVTVLLDPKGVIGAYVFEASEMPIPCAGKS